MKVGLIGDLHLGNHRAYGGELAVGLNDRAVAILRALEMAVHEAVLHGCERLVLAGDVFDTSAPLPQQLYALGTALQELHSWLLVGNHDRVSRLPNDHSLGPLYGWETLTVFDRPTPLGSWLMLPFDTEAPARLLAGVLSEPVFRDAPVRFVVGHFGLYDEGAAPWMKDAQDAVRVEEISAVCAEHGITHLFVGNYHTAARWKRRWNGKDVHLIQLGALVPTGWDNPGLEGYGGLVVFDTEALTLERVEIPGPRFLSFATYEQGLAGLLPLADNGGQPRYVKWTVAHDKMGVARRIAEEAAIDGVYVQLLPDGAQVENAAFMAASAARSKTTLHDAAHAFIERLVLPEGIERGHVHGIARRLLKL